MMNVMKKKLNKKGFTLAELLVVVAIIAILVAVSIPIFTSRLEASREATDQANERAAKAAAVTAYLGGDGTDTTFYYDADNGVAKDANTGIEAYGKSTASGDMPTHVDMIVKVTVTPAATVDADPTVQVSWEAAAATE